MTLSWLTVLIIYGFCTSWNIDPLAWLLLVPFFVQDIHDNHRR